MINAKKLTAALVAGMLTFAITGCTMIQKTPSAIKNATVAKIGKTTITKGQVDDRLKSYIEQLKAQYGENYATNEDAKSALKTQAQQTLDSMVDEEVLLQKAKEKNLVPEASKLDEEAKTQIEQIKKDNFSGDQAKFEEALKTYGYTADSFNAYVKNQVIMNKVIDDLIKDITVDDKKVSDYYAANTAEFTQKPGAKFQHMLFKTEDEAKAVKSRIDKGEKFDEIAKQLQADSSKGTYEDLGFIEYDSTQYDKDFMAGAKVLKENEVSGPVKSSFGYHIIKATGIKSEAVVQPLESVKDTIKSNLLNSAQSEKYNTTMTEWKKQLGVKTYPKNL